MQTNDLKNMFQNIEGYSIRKTGSVLCSYIILRTALNRKEDCIRPFHWKTAYNYTMECLKVKSSFDKHLV